MTKILVTMIALAVTLPAFAGERTTIRCTKKGFNGQPKFAKVDLVFDISKDGRNDQRSIRDVRGEVRAAYDMRELFTNDAYIGLFDSEIISEDMNYKPNKYKNSSKFPKFDAKKTTGAESGMWGYLVVPKNIRGQFESHYVFQAGDHMGGTIHMDCKKQ